MKKITQLVNSLSASEVKLIRKYYAISAKIEHNLKIKLFEIALVNKNISDNEAAKLMGKTNNAAFSMLKSRLQEDIMKILIVEGKDKIFNTKYYKARHKVHFMLLEMDILEDRSLREQATETIMKAKRIAQKFELINDLVVINDIILNGYVMRQGPSAFKKLRKSGIKELKMADDLFWGTDYFKQTTMPSLYNTNKYISNAEKSKIALDKLEQLTETTEISRLQYFYFRSQSVYYRSIKDFKSTKRVALNFLNFIENHSILNTKDNIGGSNMLVADACLNLKQYDEAIRYSTKGLDFFYKNSANQINMYEIIFYSNFYLKNNLKALEIIEYIESIKTIKPGNFLYSKWLYFKANAYFKKADYKNVLKILKRQSTLKTDKSGWGLGYRILELISLIELKQYDNLPYRVDAFRRQLKTINNENVTRPKAILQTISKLIKSNFNFIVVEKENGELLKNLRKGNNDYYWEPTGYEITRFDEWWDSKLIL